MISGGIDPGFPDPELILIGGNRVGDVLVVQLANRGSSAPTIAGLGVV
jgi:hypothetical protein